MMKHGAVRIVTDAPNYFSIDLTQLCYHECHPKTTTTSIVNSLVFSFISKAMIHIIYHHLRIYSQPVIVGSFREFGLPAKFYSLGCFSAT